MKLIAGAVMLAMLTGSAAAADLGRMPTKAPAREMARTFSWTAVYVGGFVGYHFGDLRIQDCVGICPTNPKLRGVVGGVQFGGDYQFANNVVLGAFGVIPIGKPDTTISPAAGVVFPMETKFVIVSGARLGYAFNNVLPYIMGGYAHADVRGTSSVTGIVVEQSHSGYVIGGGVEYAFAPRWSVDARYTYMHMGDEPYNFGGGVVRWSENSSNVTLGVNFRWDGR